MQVYAAVALPRDRAADRVDDAEHPAALALDLLHRCQRVVGLAGLADPDVEGSFLDHRPPVPELRRWLGVGRYSGQLLDQLGAKHAGVVGGAAAQDLHPLDAAGIARVEVEPAQVRGVEPVVEAAAEHALDDARLLVDLLVHEVGVAVGVVAGRVRLDYSRRLGGAPGVEGGRPESVGLDGGDLAVVQVHDLPGVADQRRHVGCREHLLVADAEQNRAAIAGNDQPVRPASIQHGQAVGADDALERPAHRFLEVRGLARVRQAWARACLRCDQVREDLTVGLRGELRPVRDQLGPEFLRVLDDAVVHDRDRPAHVRVRVNVARLAMCRPPGVPDAWSALHPGGHIGG